MPELHDLHYVDVESGCCGNAANLLIIPPNATVEEVVAEGGIDSEPAVSDWLAEYGTKLVIPSPAEEQDAPLVEDSPPPEETAEETTTEAPTDG